MNESTMFPKLFTMVGRNNDHVILEETYLLKFEEHASEHVVGVTDLTVIESLRPRQIFCTQIEPVLGRSGEVHSIGLELTLEFPIKSPVPFRGIVGRMDLTRIFNLVFDIPTFQRP